MRRVAVTLTLLGFAAALLAAPPPGPLRPHPDNPRYFTPDGERAVLLAGSHTWASVADMSPDDPPAPFDFDAFAEWTAGYGHNFMRLWAWELVNWDTHGNGARNSKNKILAVAPHPWARTGPGKALDGKPKFDLTRFDPEYFRRVRSRVETAAAHGLYVSIMLFEGWGVQFSPNAWANHPFHPDNNINGVDGDANGDGKGLEIHTLRDPRITDIQRAYVRKVIDAVNDLDNVLFEIGNETHPTSSAWQYAMIEFIHDYERGKPKQHPVGMTFQHRGGSNQILFDSPADWISPRLEREERENPWPASGSRGGKVLLADTDHIWGIGGTASWVWKSVTRGMNPLFMDPYDGVVLGEPFDPRWELVRKNMGYARTLTEKLPLASMTPHGELASTGFCLADPGRAYLIFAPVDTDVTVDLSGVSGELGVEWLNPVTGESKAGGRAAGGSKATRFLAPFPGDVVLALWR